MDEQAKQRLFELQQRHEELDKNIAWGYSFYLDDVDMKKMKYEKLTVKREIEGLLARKAA